MSASTQPGTAPAGAKGGIHPEVPEPVRAPAKPRRRLMRQTELVDRGQGVRPRRGRALLNKAYVYAMQAHGKQFRASGDPYFAHPLEVAAILTDLKLDVATIATALLHDTVEDTLVTLDDTSSGISATRSRASSTASPSSRSSSFSASAPSRRRISAS